MKIKNEKERAINFYLSCFEVVPWSALPDIDKIYYYKEADIFENDRKLELYINKIKTEGGEL